jgi:hypothetical protein
MVQPRNADTLKLHFSYISWNYPTANSYFYHVFPSGYPNKDLWAFIIAAASNVSS